MLIERDELSETPAADAPTWSRSGVPHFGQPHAFIPRGRAELMEHFNDIYRELIDAGAVDVDARPKLPGTVVPADEELQYLAVRRPLIEWALRAAVRDESLIVVCDRSRVEGLRFVDGQVASVGVDGQHHATDLVVDALGRRSPTPGWIRDAGGAEELTDSSDCGVVYYSRYYRSLPGVARPDGPWVLGPRGDTGYLGYNTFPGDNDTFAFVLAVPTGDADWRVLNDVAAFDAAVAAIPALRLWVQPNCAEPITDVMPMAGMRNTLRHHRGEVTGVVPLGDAFSHTDPTLALGLAFGLIHATELAVALDDFADATDAVSAFTSSAVPQLQERYALATGMGAQRRRHWMGDPVDLTHHRGDYELFTLVAGGATAAIDPDIFRMFNRRMGLLERTTILDSDVELQQRIEDLFGQMNAVPRQRDTPTRSDMLALIRSAAAA